MNPDKRDELYNNLINSGKVSEAEIGSLDDFKAAITDEASARLFHQNLLGSGIFGEDEIGSEDDFYSSISSDFAGTDVPQQPATSAAQGLAVNPYTMQPTAVRTPFADAQATQQHAQQKPTSPTQPTNPTAAQNEQEQPLGPERFAKQMAMEQQLGQMSQDFTNRMEAIRKGNQPFSSTERRLNPETGKMEDVYYTKTGEVTNTPLQQSRRNAEINEAFKEPTVNEELQGAYAERDRLQQEIARREKEIETSTANNVEEGIKKLPATQQRAMAEILRRNAPREGDKSRDAELSMLRAALRSNEERINILEREKDNPNYIQVVGKGLTSADNWLGGFNNLADMITMLRYSGEELEGTEAAAQEAMLKNRLLADDANTRYGQNDPAGQRWGDISAQAIPFVAEFLLTGGGFSGIKAGTRLGEKAALKYGKNKVGKWLLKNIGSTADDIVRASIMANTTGAGRTVSDILDRRLGNLVYEDGEYKFVGGKSVARSVYEGEMAATIEYLTEFAGSKLDAAGKVVGKGISKGLEKIGAGRVTELISRMSGSEWNKMLAKLQVNDYWEEVAEEELNIILNAALVGDNKFSDLWDKRTQGDILGGMALSIGLMRAPGMVVEGGAKTYNTAQYYRYKHNTDKADKVASVRFGADNWEALRERIDNTENKDMGALLAEIADNADMNDGNKKAAADYIVNLMKMRGYNMRTMKNAEGKSESESSEQAVADEQESQAYERGYNADPQEQQDAMLELAMSDPSDPDHADKQATVDGINDRINDEADNFVAQQREAYNLQRNDDDGSLHPATMNIDGQQRQVFIKSGLITTTPNGSIDTENSGETIVVYDPVEGKCRMVSPSEIAELGEVVPQDQFEADLQNQRADLVQQQQDAATGRFNPKPGDEVAMPDGNKAFVMAVNGDNVTLQLPDGTQQDMSIADIQQIADGVMMNDYRQRHPETAAETATETSPTDSRPQMSEGRPDTYESGMQLTIQRDGEEPQQVTVTDIRARWNPTVGYVEDPNGRFVQVQMPDGSLSYIEADDPRGIITGYMAAPQEEPQREYHPIDQGNPPDDGGTPPPPPAAVGNLKKEETEPIQPIQPINPMPMRQVKRKVDGKMTTVEEEDWMATTPARAYQYLYDEAAALGLPVETADNILQANLKAAQKDVDRAKKSTGAIVTVLQKIKDAEAAVDYWQQVADMRQAAVDAERQAVLAEDARTAAERRAANQEEKETAQGVPDMSVDKAADARRRGFRMSMGNRYDRQEPVQGLVGNEVEIKFNNEDKPKGVWMVLEDEQLQPSHMRGQLNPMHFITEAQPKDRTDNVSDVASDRIAAGINPSEITQGPTAYVGAPVVNNRGEVIQGNNRAIALKKLRGFPESAATYKQYLMDHAAEFGLDAEAIAQMQNPVLVRAIDATDDEAIRLGQYTASDTETGGIQRINAGNVLGQLDDQQTNTLLNMLLESGDDDMSLGEIIDRNAGKVMSWLSRNGAINATQYQSAYGRNGQMTTEAKADLRNLITHNIFKGGADQLATAWGSLPVSTQKALAVAMAGDLKMKPEDRLLPYVQNAIMAVAEIKNSEMAANARTKDELFKAIDMMNSQTDIFSGTPIKERYDELELDMAVRFLTQKQKAIQAIFDDYQRYITGGKRQTNQTSMFGEENIQPMSKEEAVERVFGIKNYKQDNNGNIQRETGGVEEGGSPRRGDVEPGGRQTPDEGGTGREKTPEPAATAPDNNTAAVAERITAAEAQTDTNPTEAQKKAGNYKMGHVSVDGYDISIENPKGSIRRGTDPNGHAWEQEMHNTYGYIRGTEGVDGDHIDVFLSDDPTQGNVFVIDQVNANGSFDEHKVMYGFPDAESARQAYLSNYEDGWQGLGTITEVSKDEFKKWIESSHRKTKPFSEYKSVKPEGAQAEQQQPSSADTSTSTTADDKFRDDLNKLLEEYNSGDTLMSERDVIEEARRLFDDLPTGSDMAKRLADAFAEYDDMQQAYYYENGQRDDDGSDAMIAALQNAANEKPAEQKKKQKKNTNKGVDGFQFNNQGVCVNANKISGGDKKKRISFDILTAKTEKGWVGSYEAQGPTYGAGSWPYLNDKEIFKTEKECQAAMAEDAIRYLEHEYAPKAVIDSLKKIAGKEENTADKKNIWKNLCNPKKVRNFASDFEKKNQWVDEHFDEIVDAYIAANGNKLDPDELRKAFTSIGYDGSNVPDFKEQEKKVRKAVYSKLLKNAVENGNPSITLLTGVGGAGKSTATKQIDLSGRGVIFDSAFNSFKSLDKNIAKAKEAGMTDIQVIAVHNDAFTAFSNTVNRGLATGRFLSLKYFVDDAFNENQGKIEALRDKYPDVEIICYDNSGNKASERPNGGRVSVEEATRWNYTIDNQLLNQLIDIFENGINEGRFTPNQAASIGQGLRDLERRGTEDEWRDVEARIGRIEGLLRRHDAEMVGAVPAQRDGRRDRRHNLLGSVVSTEDGGVQGLSGLPQDGENREGKLLVDGGSGYSITPKQYTTKRGRVLDMQLVTFERELSKEELAAAKELAKSEKGWWSREDNGFMMRSSESAKRLTDFLNRADEDVIEDVQPLSLDDVAKVNDNAISSEKAEKTTEETQPETEQTSETGSTNEENEDRSYGANNQFVSRDRYEELKKLMRKKLRGQLNAGIDPEILSLGMEMAAYHIEAGARKFADFAKRMVQELGDAIRPYLKSFYNGARDMPQMAEIADEMTPYEEVREFDVLNFDKEGPKDIIELANNISRENEAESEVEIATDKLKDSRKNNKKKEAALNNQTSLFGNADEAPAETQTNNTENGNNTDRSTEGTGVDNEGNAADLGEDGTRPDGGQQAGNAAVTPGEGNSGRASDEDREPDGGQQELPSEGGLRRNGSGRDSETGAAGDVPARPVQVIEDKTVEHGDTRTDNHSPLTPKEKNTPKNTRNYLYPADASEIDNYTPAERLRTNVEALEVLRNLIREGREATTAERAIMGKLRGWGGVNIPDRYTAEYRNWELSGDRRKLVDILKELDPQGELKLLESLQTAALTSYYTPIPIAKAMHSIVEVAGYKGVGAMLDPSMGNGVFEGTMKKGIQQTTQIRGVELDWLTGQIARRIYPDAKVDIMGLQDAHIPENHYDYVVSNIPFGSLQVTDLDWQRNPSPIRKTAQNRIHNYFTVKMIESTRPGGLCVIMTSNAVMDTKGNAPIRKYITENCEILGAMRLPNNTFKGAGTSVVTDVIYLRKFRDENDRVNVYNNTEYASNILEPFLNVKEGKLKDRFGNERPVFYNGYYHSNKKNVIGDAIAGGQYSDEAYDLKSDLATDQIADQMTKIGKRFMEQRKKRLGDMVYNTTKPTAQIVEAVKESYKGNGNYEGSGNIAIQDGKIGKLEAVKEGNGKRLVFVEQGLGGMALQQVEDYIKLRTLLKRLIDAQIENYTDDVIAGIRSEMQQAYEDYTGKYGKLRDKKNNFIDQDIDSYQVRALENWKKGKFVGMADIYTKNTISSVRNMDDVSDPQAAVLNSLAEYGNVNNEYLERVLGAEWTAACGDLIFEDPAHEGSYVTRDNYLSGDVVTKLEHARLMAKEDGKWQRNVDALEKVQPRRKEFGEFPCHMGARWVPVKIYNDFLYDLFDIHSSWRGPKSGITYIEATSEYVMNLKDEEFGGKSDQYRTNKKKASEIFEAALLDKDITIFQKDENGKVVGVDQEATDAARDKVQMVRDAFEDWVVGSQERTTQLADAYNNVFNRFVLPTYNGQHLNIVGMQGKDLRPHQKDAVWRIINQRGGIIDHMVGAGKTLVMQASIMEMRRMGIAKKPMILALKATTSQLADSFRKVFPASRVLAPDEKDFSTANRKKFLAQIAVNDYDCIILSHEQYSALDHSDHIKRSFIEDQIDQLDNLIEYLYGTDDQSQLSKKQIKGLEKRRENLKEKLKKLDLIKTDDEFVFENLGVDYLFVDECQAFKNLMFQTSYSRIAGLGNPDGSERSTKLLYGIRSLQEMHQGDMGTVFLSGTTISNSLSELYNIFNYLRPNEMCRMGLNTFDAWASTFAVRSTEAEFGVTNELKEKSRFRKFEGLQELSRLYTEIADVRNDSNLELPKPKMNTHFVAIPISDTMREINKNIVSMVQKMDGSYFGIHPENKDKYPWSLAATNLAKKATLSPRLIDDSYDDENGKIAHACENVAKIYKKFNDQKGVQLIFCDSGVPDSKKSYDAYTDITNRLTEQYGIPRNEIVDIHVADNAEKRHELFDRVNNGDVRILIGGTKNMGTGVNVQRRVVAMHHLDIPWTPADVNQRNGRGARQHNEVARDYNDNKVDTYYYAVEQTLDTYRYQLQDVKGKMIDAFKTANVGLDEFDEGGDAGDEGGAMNAAEMVAILSGNPVILDKAKQDKLVDKLNRLKRSSLMEHARRKEEYNLLQTRKKNMERLIANNQRDIDKIAAAGFKPDKNGDFPPVNVTITQDNYSTEGKTFDKAGKAGKAIIDEVKNTGTCHLYSYGVKAQVMTNNTPDGSLFSNKRVEASNLSGIEYSVNLSEDETAAGQAMQNLLKKVYSYKDKYAKQLDEINHKLEGGDPGEYVFAKQDELDAAIQRKREIDTEYNKLITPNKPQAPTKETEPTAADTDDIRFRSLDPESDNIVDNAEVGTRPLSDREKVAKLEAEPKVKVYRSMQLIDGELYPPMSAKSEGQLREPSRLGVWEEADERPDLADNNGKFTLNKGNGKSLKAAYNPYIHTSRTMLNDQFSEAQSRPNLVVVEMEVPESELTSDYKAEKAKDSVGAKEWKAGVIQGQLSGTREVILSRWAKPVRIVPDSEVAANIAEQIDGQVAVMPSNVVTPSVRAELEKLGVQFVETDNTGKLVDGPNKGKTWASVYGKKTRQAEQAKRDTAQRLADALHTNINIVTDVDSIQDSDPDQLARKRRSPGWYNHRTHEVTLVLPNNSDAVDAASTVFHETVGHKGMRELVGDENYDTLLDEVYSHLTDELKEQVDHNTYTAFMDDILGRTKAEQAEGESRRSYEQHRRIQTDELMARLAESQPEEMTDKERSLWQRICDLVRRAIDRFLNDVGVKLPRWVRLGENEIRYMLWRSRQHLEQEGYVGMAKDIAKRHDLGLDDQVSFRDASDDSDLDDLTKDDTMGLKEKYTAWVSRLAAQNRDDDTMRRNALRAIGDNLNDIRRAVSIQKQFDQSTVKRVADLARVLLSGGYLDNLTSGEVKRLLSAVKNSTGRSDITASTQKVMDIMVDNQLKRAEKLLHDLETVKAKKVNAKGVEVQGDLDLAGQQMITAFKKGRALSSKEAIEQHIAEAQDRMGSSNQTIADEAANEYAGLQLALQYAEDIKGSEDEESDLRDELERARLEARRPDGIFADKEAYDQYRASIEDNIRQNRIERLQAYLDLAASLTGSLGESVKNALAFNEAEKERVADIQHNANSDMEGRPSKEHYTPDWKAKTVNNPFAQFFLQPLATFDQMLRLFGSKSANGEGYLYNRFMRGWVDAREKEIRGVRQKYAALDAKVKQLFGKDASNMADLIRRIGDMPKMRVQFWDGGAMRDHTLTQGNLMYIYMADKMDDGRLKLRAMGVKEDDIAKITRALDPRLIELADWLQDEFLVNTRNEYNETHKRLFGASMAAIDKYFPLKILANARADKPEDLDNPNFNEGVSTTTGSIIKRRRNALALDVLNADALNVVLDHVAQMEHWNAFAEWNRDLNTLRTYKRFRNQVQNMTTVYGSGKELWKKFNDVSQMAAGSYRPPRATLDAAAVNIAKGVTAAKVSFRVFTALKQFLSMPAYIPEARPELWAKNLATPWNSWNWAMDNLPIFEERWKSRMAGDPRLLKSELDWKGWRNNIVQMASRIGMAPNAFVDALTVSIGAKTIYETRRARYLKEGYSEEQADQRARQDAEIAYNQTQQSSEGAFLSPMQVDRSWLSVMFTVFRNSSMAYQRQLHDALRNLKRDLKKGNREQSIEFMAKQLQRDGLPEDKAQAAAKSRYDRQMGKDLLRVATFGYILQLAWNLGAKLPYLLFGGDDDKKDEMMDDVWAQSMFGWGEGLTGGDVFSQGGKMLVQGKGNPEYLMKEMPIASDAKDVLQELGQGKYGEVINDMVNLVVQAGIGVNPQSITDAVLAIMDACGDDPALAHEATIAVMRILQVPQSQIKEMYFDELGLSGSEVSNYTPQQLVERYARYQVKRGRLLAPWTWNDESILDKERKKATKVVKERVSTFGDEYNEALDGYEQTYNEVKERINNAYNEAKQEHDYIKKAQIIDEVRRSDEQAFTTYDDYMRFDKQLDDMVAKYLAAKTPDQAALAHDDLLGFKSRMVELLGTADEKQRRKLRFQLNEYYSDFKREYEAAAPPPPPQQ